MLKSNRTKDRLNRGETCFGTMLRALNSLDAIPMAAAAGWDYVILDSEHRAFGLQRLSDLCLISKYEPSLTTLVRVPDKSYHHVARTLDLGAEGLVLPRVDTRDEVDRIIQAAKYHPLGSRGASISQVATRYRAVPARQYLDWANRETLIVIQIESEAGVENVDSLVSAEGVDAVMIGPFDLSQDMGIPGELEHPRLVDAYRRVIAGCRRHGVAPGVHLLTVPSARQWIQEGMRLLTFQYDALVFKQRSQEILETLRQPGESETAPSSSVTAEKT